MFKYPVARRCYGLRNRQISQRAIISFAVFMLTATQLLAADIKVKVPTGSAISAFENQIARQLISQIDADFLVLPIDGLGLEYRAARIIGSRLAVLEYYQQQIMSLDTALLNPRNRLRLDALKATHQQLRRQRDNALQDAALSPYHGPHVDLLRLVSLFPINPDPTNANAANPDNGVNPLLAELLLLGRALDKPATFSPLVTPQECVAVIAHLAQLLETSQLTDGIDVRLLDAGFDAATRRQYAEKFSAALQQHVLPGIRRLVGELSCENMNVSIDSSEDSNEESNEESGEESGEGSASDTAYYAYRLQLFGAAGRHADALHVLGQDALRDLQGEINRQWQGLHPDSRNDQSALTQIRKDTLLYLGNTATDRQAYLSRISDLVMSVSEQLDNTVLDLPLPDLEIIAEPDLLAPFSLPFSYRFPDSGSGQLAVNFNATASISQHQLTARTYYSSVPGLHLVRHGFINQQAAGVSPLLDNADNPAYFKGWSLYLSNLLLNDANQISLARLGLLELNAEMIAMLVIDTGIHSRGWSRQAAINFLVANTVIATYHAERLVDEVRFRPASMNSAYLGMTQIEALLADAPKENGSKPPPPSWEAALAAGPVAAGLQKALRDWLARYP